MISTLRTLGMLGIVTVVATVLSSNMSQVAADDRDEPSIGFATAPSQDPVLVYDVTGSTLIGMVHFRLTVYNSGSASVSDAGFTIFDPPDDECPDDGRAAFTFVGTSNVKALQAALKKAGAFEAGDSVQGNPDIALPDVPLQTVTVFADRRGDQLAHTFNFHAASTPEIQATLAVINAFIDEHFPGY